MGVLLWLAAILVAAWIVLALFVKVAGFGVHLLLFIAALTLILWAVRRMGATGTSSAP